MEKKKSIDHLNTIQFKQNQKKKELTIEREDRERERPSFENIIISGSCKMKDV
jgi:hypothetical protein